MGTLNRCNDSSKNVLPHPLTSIQTVFHYCMCVLIVSVNPLPIRNIKLILR
jgi:hypothetical protein